MLEETRQHYSMLASERQLCDVACIIDISVQSRDGFSPYSSGELRRELRLGCAPKLLLSPTRKVHSTAMGHACSSCVNCL